MRIPDKRKDLRIEPLLVPTAVVPRPDVEMIAELERVMTDEGGHASPALVRAEWAFSDRQKLPMSHASILVSSGSAGIRLALEALDIGAYDRVVVPGLAPRATAVSVLDVNAAPVPLDVDAHTWTLDPTALESYLERCKDEGMEPPEAVIVVHLNHMIADMDRLVDICRRWKIFLIEDCAHAHGGAWNGRPVGTFGVVSVFSDEHPAGRSGLCVTGVPLLEQRLRSLREYGCRIPREELHHHPTLVGDELTAHWRSKVDELRLAPWPIQGADAEATPLAAAVLSKQCERFGALADVRNANVYRLDRALASMRGITRLAIQPQVTNPIAYRYGLMYDPSEYAGMHQELFMEVLSYLLGGYSVLKPYSPLGGGPAGYRSTVYHPNSMRRNALSDKHRAAFDPRRMALDNCHMAYRTGITLPQELLLEPDPVPAIVEGLEWMRANAERIVASDTAGEPAGR